MSLSVNTRLTFLSPFCKCQDLLNFLVSSILDYRLQVVILEKCISTFYLKCTVKKVYFQRHFLWVAFPEAKFLGGDFKHVVLPLT